MLAKLKQSALDRGQSMVGGIFICATDCVTLHFEFSEASQTDVFQLTNQ